ncbi:MULTISPECIES: hypothetical protein [unclassified Janibacter]|uniref:hypothetical protein n=1 Tax=unclassified Janibacter TaxID=2649294 RepID=UPI003D04EA95
MSAPGFQLRSGDTGPVQQSPVTCGSACLTVARMLVDPAFARWMTTGEPRLPGLPVRATEQERFAAHERLVLARTNGVRGWDGSWSLPWPRSLGTPPWGARRELEFGASRNGTTYETVVLRGRRPAALARGFHRLREVVAHGEPALLFVGDRWLPRHVTLVLPGDGGAALDVYDPGTGRVTELDAGEFRRRDLHLSGWSHPWIAVQPTGLRRVPVTTTSAERIRHLLPHPNGPVPETMTLP